MRIRISVSAVVALLAAMCFCIACGTSNSAGDASSLAVAPEISLPWPPSAENAKLASNGTLALLGQQYSDCGGPVAPNESPAGSLLLDGPAPLPWAVYSAGGFWQEAQLARISLEFQVFPDTPGDKTAVYLGLANYGLQAWEWRLAEPSAFTVEISEAADYISPTGNAHAAFVLSGPGTAVIEEIAFEHTGNHLLPVPGGLRAAADPGSIELAWEDEPEVQGFHVYRSEHKSLPAPIKLTSGSPLQEPAYVDDTVVAGTMYFYFVTAADNGFESAPSSYVDIYAPQISEALPGNLAGLSTSENNYTVAWNWQGAEPEFFRIYYSDESDFNLTVDAPRTIQVPGAQRSAWLVLDGFGDTVYWRVSSYSGGSHGRMSDDLAAHPGPWKLGPVEEIDDLNSRAPFSAISVDNDISLAYRWKNFMKFGRRTDGEWAVEMPDGYYSQGYYLDMTYANGQYIIGSQTSSAADLVARCGLPGDWTHVKVHGNGDVGPSHKISGMYAQIAASDTEAVIVHSEYLATVMAHSMSFDTGEWSEPDHLWVSVPEGNHMSLAEKDGNFYLLWFYNVNGLLYFANYADGWAPINVFEPGASGMGMYNTLTWFEGEWWSAGYDGAGDHATYMHHGTDVPWASELFIDSAEHIEMTAMDTKLACSYMRQGGNSWALAVYDGGGWEARPLSLPEGEVEAVALSHIGDSPYVVFGGIVYGSVAGLLVEPD